MILRAANKVKASDYAQYAWSGLRRFQNINYVRDRILSVHGLDSAHAANARKQATQIRYCLLQAKEYFDAGQAVTLITKPNLFYYCAMLLALAEVLFKQDGLSSLDRARAEHRHHGLELEVKKPNGKALKDAGAELKARPLVRNSGARFGTFELWHQSAREMPILGPVITRYPHTTNTTTTWQLIFGPSDCRLNPIPCAGLTFSDCLSHIPGMMTFANTHNLNSQIVRGKVQVSLHPALNQRSDFQLVVHPGWQSAIDDFMSDCLFDPNEIDNIQVEGAHSGAIVQWSQIPGQRNVLKHLPHASMCRSEEIQFWPQDQPLNEFGFLYVSLFIAGNYARYYPDMWVRDVEEASPLALAIEQLLSIATDRLALLTLSELSGTYLIPDE